MLALKVGRAPLTSTRNVRNVKLVAIRCFKQTAFSNNVTLETISQELPPPGRMMAWQVQSYGNEDVLKLSTLHPEPILRKPGDVKVEVLATSVNPIDVAMVGGYGATLLNTIHQVENCSAARGFPIVLGRDFVGKVEATGLGVSNVKAGDEVWGVVAPWAQGAHAQKVIVPAWSVRRKPQNLTAIEMAALPYVSVTAWSALKITGEMALCDRGQRILILGGAGGVGSVAVQMAKSWDAYVVATCRTDAVPLVESLGANGVVDYTQPDFMMKVKEHGHFDIILDAAGVGSNAGQYADHVKHWSNAKYVTLSSPLLRNIDQYGLGFGLLRNVSALLQANINTGLLKKGASSRWGFFIPTPPCLDEIQRLATSGKLSPIVQDVFSFRNMPDAFRRLKEGHLRGKIVIDGSS